MSHVKSGEKAERASSSLRLPGYTLVREARVQQFARASVRRVSEIMFGIDLGVDHMHPFSGRAQVLITDAETNAEGGGGKDTHAGSMLPPPQPSET